MLEATDHDTIFVSLIDFGEARPIGCRAPRPLRIAVYSTAPEIVREFMTDCSAGPYPQLNITPAAEVYALGSIFWSMCQDAANMIPPHKDFLGGSGSCYSISRNDHGGSDEMPMPGWLKLPPLASSSSSPLEQEWAALVADCLAERPERRPSLADIVRRTKALAARC